MSAFPPIWPVLPASPSHATPEPLAPVIMLVPPGPIIAAAPEPEPEVAKGRPMPKLSRTMMRSWVAGHLKTKQGNTCPLCNKHIDLKVKGEGVIDHDHDTGEIRGVLHRSCNAAEGKISNAAARWGAKSASYADVIAYLERVVQYLKQPGAGIIYPMHKTVDEKKDARNLAAKKKRAEAKAKLALRSRKVTP